METKTIRNLQELDRWLQDWLDKIGRSDPRAKLLQAEYNVRLIRVGEMIQMENGDLSPELARELPLSTPLGPDARLAVAEMLEYLSQLVEGFQLQTDFAKRPLS